MKGGGGGGDGGVEGRGHIDCAGCIGGAGKLTRVHILQHIHQSNNHYLNARRKMRWKTSQGVLV